MKRLEMVHATADSEKTTTGEMPGADTDCCDPADTGCCDLQIPVADDRVGPGCSTPERPLEKRRIDVEFLYGDLSVCTRCQGTEASLDDALDDVTRVLEPTGTEVVVHKVHVESEEQARDLHFVSSPTIRINGRDIQARVIESRCESCGDLCGEDVNCRVWVYQGKEYTTPPKGLIIDAILREVYGGGQGAPAAAPGGDVPENLRRFFADRHRKLPS